MLLIHFFISFMIIIFVEASSRRVPCERFEGTSCLMTIKTVIDSFGTIISTGKNEVLASLTFDGNKKVSYLPIKVHKSFPNLRNLTARNCSLKSISRYNFENLTKLDQLRLDYNQIKKISSEAFRDLKSLTLLILGEIFDDFKKLFYDFLYHRSQQNKILEQRSFRELAQFEKGFAEFERLYQRELYRRRCS